MRELHLVTMTHEVTGDEVSLEYHLVAITSIGKQQIRATLEIRI